MINLCIRICYNGISPGINCLSTKKKKKKVFVVVVTFCFYRWEFFFKLIKIEEEKKKREIVILCCSTIFQRVFSYNLYFLKVGEKKKKNFKSEIKKKKPRKKQVLFKTRAEVA